MPIPLPFQIVEEFPDIQANFEALTNASVANTVNGQSPNVSGNISLGLGRFAATGTPPASWGVGGNTIASQTIIIANPAGATVRWTGGCSGYTSSVGTVSRYMLNTDGLGWATLATPYYFNATSDHRWMGTFEFLNNLSAGVHTLYFGAITSAGTVTADSNDYYTFAAYELP